MKVHSLIGCHPRVWCLSLAFICSTAVLAQTPSQDAASVASTAWLSSLSAPVHLEGTLAKVQASGAVAIGYRDSSVPFSYLDTQGKPIGYSIELCRLLVQAIAKAVNRPVEVRWVPVTSATRFDAITSGRADLECGSTTSNRERQKTVAFSPTFFVAGTKLLVRKGSPVRDYLQLKGRKVAVTAGTTNEKTLRELSDRFKLDLQITPMRDHAESFAQVTQGTADAFATDDVLLYGLIAQTPGGRGQYAVVGDFLSYDPYGVMFRKDDPQLAKLVAESFQALAADGEIERQYRRWFQRKLPGGGQTLNLPMSPQLEVILESLAATQKE
ncbi:amino acid ABC transporter substrate-binding protein [Diaphorobacter aerolatus]|uniref:Amino acid ABC transporter substrate-binding protein n=1 Tax=Diaphorobacter aerolatus TaxID=1288495 RepID=A0A7H0GHY9_9BURK|nr:amino acid ABC transporter substrate-binding protein [Diaphorobacter aerolatus]QNP47905.1 amino acid ABC transporter substrate-binding protein [Diaphorobacter aerolatus]